MDGQRLLDLNLRTYLLDDLLVKTDRLSMAHGLEVRCPFLDTAVIDLAARLPASMLMRVRGKWLLRRATRKKTCSPHSPPRWRPGRGRRSDGVEGGGAGLARESAVNG